MNTPSTIYGRRWSEKEYIVCLYYYHKHKKEPQHVNSPFIKELSQILGRTAHSVGVVLLRGTISQQRNIRITSRTGIDFSQSCQS